MDILFLPGYACTSQIWQPLVDRLPARHTVTLLDWPRGAAAGFHALSDVVRWSSGWLAGRHFDCVVGHSMGGLVALELIVGSSAIAGGAVLVESFIRPPGPFFRNLMLREASIEAMAVRRMLSAEKPYYPPALADGLRDVDMTERVARLSVSLHALYGDRGCGDEARVRAELGWPAALSACVDLHVIPDACHFPMFENPAATAEALRSMLD